MQPGQWFAVAFGILFYFGILFFFIRMAVKWGRKSLTNKTEAVGAQLSSQLGAKVVAVVPNSGMGLYRGVETEYEVNGRRVFTNAYYVSRSYVRVNLRIPAGPLPYVIVYPETGVDRFGKAVGLNREVQTGDKAFDDLAYIDTVDKDEVVARLFSRPELREAVREILAAGYKAQFSRSGVEAFQLVYGLKKVDASNATAVTQALTRVADAVPGFVESELGKTPSRYSLLGFALMLLAIMGAGGAGGLSTLTNRTLAGGHEAMAYLGFGGLGWLGFCALGLVAVRGRSYAMRMLIIIAVIGLIGVPALSGALVLLLNQTMDKSAVITSTTRINKLTHTKDTHKIYIDSWLEPGAQQSLYVPHGLLQTMKTGDAVQYAVHPGAFGWPWVEVLGKSEAAAAP